MSYSETSYQNWIQAQLEPDAPRLATGRKNHITPKWVERNRCIAKLQEEMGIEEYRRRSEEDAAKAREWYEHENNL